MYFRVKVQDFVETLKVIKLQDPDLRGLPYKTPAVTPKD
jgi:hypothetical protein